MFEPINSLAFPEPPGRFFGIDTGLVDELAERVKARYGEVGGDATLVDFDERDLIGFAEDAGFTAVEVDYEARVHQGAPPWFDDMLTWELALRTSGNPCAPTLGEALDGALETDERQVFEAHVRPRFEARDMQTRAAVAYLRARK